MTALAPLEVYVSHLRRGELAYQVDVETGAPVFFPRMAAPGTGAALEWRISSGRGTVYTTTVMHRRDREPINLAMIELDEGFRMMSRVEGIEAAQVRIGMRVLLAIEEGLEGNAPLPLFRPDEEATS